MATRTEPLLNCIASHLSSRPECRNLRYSADISSNGRIVFEPNIQVFPSRYRRKPGDRTDVLDHVLREHFPDVIDYIDDSGYIYVDTSKIVPGRYKYVLRIDRKRRCWSRT